MTDRGLTLTLTPHGHLLLAEVDEAPALPTAVATRLREAFQHGSGHGLLSLGTCDVGDALPPVIAWWRDFAARFVTALCTLPEAIEQVAGRVTTPALGELQALAWSAPPMVGAEYLNAEVLQALWTDLDVAFHVELATSGLRLQEFLKARHPAWHLVGRVHVHLAENRKDERAPFAFLATYTTRLSAQGKAQHQPLGQALREYAGAADKERLLALLMALVGGRGFAVPSRRSTPGAGWGGGAHAGHLAGEPTTARTGNSHRRRWRAIPRWPGRVAGFLDRDGVGGRAADRRRGEEPPGEHPGPGPHPRPLGRDRSRTPAADPRPFPAGSAPGHGAGSGIP
jgi:hypothetical protein